MTFGNRLVGLRNRKPVAAVAAAVGVSPTALNMYESNRRIPRDEVKARLAAYYGVTMQQIFGEEKGVITNMGVCEEKIRYRAKKIGLRIEKRTERQYSTVGYMLIDSKNNTVVAGGSPIEYSLSLEQLEQAVSELEDV